MTMFFAGFLIGFGVLPLLLVVFSIEGAYMRYLDEFYGDEND